MTSSSWMVVAFMLGAGLRLFEENLRRRRLLIALRNPLRGEQVTKFQKLLSAAPFYVRWRVMLMFLLWPELAIRQAHHVVATRDSGDEPCTSGN
jgi:hypothetical protein